LVGTKAARDDRAYQAGPVPLEFAVRGFHSAALPEAHPVETAALLTNTMGFKLVGEDGGRFRYAVDSGESAALVDVVPASQPGRILAGTVHHIAWRTPDDQQQLKWLDELTRLRYGVSPVKDRKYFHSIYFREPGGILFEIATDPPGFTVDEPLEHLGSKLALPAQFEPMREHILSRLPVVHLSDTEGR